MRYQMLDILSCPKCHSFPLRLESQKILLYEPDERFHVDGLTRCDVYCAFHTKMIDHECNEDNLDCKDCFLHDVDAGLLVCEGCGAAYKIEEGIPLLLKDGSVEALISDKSSDAVVQKAVLDRPESIKTKIRELVEQQIPLSSRSLSRIEYEKLLNDIDYRINHAEDKDYYVYTFSGCLERKPQRILDVGMGQGGVLSCLNRHLNPSMSVGIDLSTDWAKIAKLRDPRINVVVADATNMPFRDDSFDLAVSSSLLEHVPLWRKVVGEIGRVSRESFLVFGPNKLFLYDYSHVNAPLITILPKSLAKYVAFFWLHLFGSKRSLESIASELNSTIYISPFEFERECKKLGLRVFDLSARLLVESTNYEYNYLNSKAHPLIGRVIKALKGSKALSGVARAISFLRVQPMLCYYISSAEPRPPPRQ